MNRKEELKIKELISKYNLLYGKLNNTFYDSLSDYSKGVKDAINLMLRRDKIKVGDILYNINSRCDSVNYKLTVADLDTLASGEALVLLDGTILSLED